MSDISMCYAKNCKDKNKCYRFTAIPDKYWQSYMDPSDKEEKDRKKCSYFWDNRYKVNNKSKEGDK